MFKAPVTDEEKNAYWDACIEGRRPITRLTPTLYIDAGPESVEAEKLLRAAKIRFDTIFIAHPERDANPRPRLNTTEGFFWSLDLIRWWTAGFGNEYRSENGTE